MNTSIEWHISTTNTKKIKKQFDLSPKFTMISTTSAQSITKAIQIKFIIKHKFTTYDFSKIMYFFLVPILDGVCVFIFNKCFFQLSKLFFQWLMFFLVFFQQLKVWTKKESQVEAVCELRWAMTSANFQGVETSPAVQFKPTNYPTVSAT